MKPHYVRKKSILNTDIKHKLYLDYVSKALLFTLCDKTYLGILYIPSLNLYR